MANTIFKLRRSSVAGKVPNTSSLSIGELAINLSDRKLYSSDGSNIFEPAANVSNLNVANVFYFTSSGGRPNLRLGSGGQYAFFELNTGGNQTLTISPNAGSFGTHFPFSGRKMGIGNYQYTEFNSNTIFQVGNNTANTINLRIDEDGTVNVFRDLKLSGAVYANGSTGSSGQILTTNGSGVYWKSDFDFATNTAAQYIWTNTHNFYANVTTNNVIVTGGIYANGEYGTLGQVLTTNGTAVYWAAGGGSANGILDVRQQYVGDGTTDTFTVTGGYRSNDLSVYINGVLLRNGVDANVADGGTFSLTIPPANGALIDVIGVGTLYSNGVNSEVNQQFTANGTANSFTISGGYLPNKILVYLNGVKQVPGTDVIVSSGSTVDFAVTPGNGYIVDVFGFNTAILSATANLDATYAWTNTHTFYEGVTLYSTLSANGSTGSAGQVLHSNGSGLYWATDADYSTNTDAQYTWTNTHTFVQTINATANSSLYIGSLAAANVVSDTQLQSNLANYQTSAGMVSNVATLTANNTQYVGTVSSANVVSNAQLQANLTNYQTTAGLASNVLVLTSNSSNYIGSLPAANVVSNAQLQANVTTLQGQITGNSATAYTNAVSYTDTVIGNVNTAIAANASAAYTNATVFASNASNVNTGTLAEARLPYRMNQNVRTSDNVEFAQMTLTGNLVVSGNVNIIGANNLSVSDNMIYLNSNNDVSSPDIGIAGNYNDGTYAHTGFFRDASDGIWKVFDNYTPEPDANVYIDTSNTSFHLANFQANTLYLGNTSTNWLIANTAGLYHTGTINVASMSVGGSTTANDIGIYSGYGEFTYSKITSQMDVTYGSYLIFDDTSNGVGSKSTQMVMEAGNNFHIYYSNSSSVYLQNTGAFGIGDFSTPSRLLVAANGNVGIGNTTPTNKLSVNGSVYVTETITVANTTGTANITPTEIFLGNSSVNCVINSTSVYVNGIDYNPTTALAIAVALS